MIKEINIGGKFVGPGQPVFIIAEAGVNHNGDLEIAKKLIDMAVEAGVDAVKFQTFQADTLVTKTAVQAAYQRQNIGKQESQYAMLKRLELPREFYPILKDYCQKKGVFFLSTPFAEKDIDFLAELDVPALKIPSGEINNIPFLRRVAEKGKPMIVSTGMSSMAEVRQAAKVIKKEGNNDLIFLHCTSNYPASPESLNMRAILTLQQELGTLIGYSDHSQGFTADIIAVALGACLIEKHFTLDRNMEGPDHRASVEPLELKAMVKAIRETEIMLGNYEKKCTAGEDEVSRVARKSIVAKNYIPKGKVIEIEDLIVKRPGTGIPPTELESVVGKKTALDIAPDDLIKASDLYE